MMHKCQKWSNGYNNGMQHIFIIVIHSLMQHKPPTPPVPEGGLQDDNKDLGQLVPYLHLNR